MIQDEATVEHGDRLALYGINMLPTMRLERIPLSHDSHGVSIHQRLHVRLVSRDALQARPSHVLSDLLRVNLQT